MPLTSLVFIPSLTLSRGKFEAVGTKAQAETNTLTMQAQSAMHNTLRVIARCVVCAEVGFILMYLIKTCFGVVSPNLDSRIVNILMPSAYEMKVIKAPLYAQIYEKNGTTSKRKSKNALFSYNCIIFAMTDIKRA